MLVFLFWCVVALWRVCLQIHISVNNDEQGEVEERKKIGVEDKLLTWRVCREDRSRPPKVGKRLLEFVSNRWSVRGRENKKTISIVGGGTVKSTEKYIYKSLKFPSTASTTVKRRNGGRERADALNFFFLLILANPSALFTHDDENEEEKSIFAWDKRTNVVWSNQKK